MEDLCVIGKCEFANRKHYNYKWFFLFNFVSFFHFSGDNKNQVHMEGYQVSNQCMALVRDGCLVPTKDAPELGYVIESSDKQYVPDVYYKVSVRRFLNRIYHS